MDETMNSQKINEIVLKSNDVSFSKLQCRIFDVEHIVMVIKNVVIYYKVESPAEKKALVLSKKFELHTDSRLLNNRYRGLIIISDFAKVKKELEVVFTFEDSYNLFLNSLSKIKA